MPASLLNRSACRTYILQLFADVRPGMPIDRVSAAALDWYEARLRATIRSDVEQHPSRGRTFNELMSKNKAS